MRRRLKYNPLCDYLASQDAGVGVLQLTFGQIEAIIGERLPKSAYDYQQWWSNRMAADYVPSHASAWLKAGWRVRKVDMLKQAVEFGRAA